MIASLEFDLSDAGRQRQGRLSDTLLEELLREQRLRSQYGLSATASG